MPIVPKSKGVIRTWTKFRFLGHREFLPLLHSLLVTFLVSFVTVIVVTTFILF